MHPANRAALEYLQAWAGITRTGYHGTKVDSCEPGRFEPAGLIVTSWLQGTSREGDPQDHIHNQVARIVRTYRDGKWRAVDTMSVRAVLGALQAIAATTRPWCWCRVSIRPGPGMTCSSSWHSSCLRKPGR